VSIHQPRVGDDSGHASHHGRDAEKQDKISKINQFHIQLLAHLLEKLSSVQEGERRLLDQCLLVYGSGLGDGNRHNHNDLPIVTFGGGGGAVKTGRHLKFAENTPLTNLYVSMLNMFGAATSKFSDSTGQLDGLV
jgi:hypothetical protein